MSHQYAQMPRAALYDETVIPEIPRLRSRRASRLARHPLVIYSAFITVSLFLLGSMAVASLPQ